MPVPNTFGTATTSIPLSQLDANFNTPVTIGSTSVGLGNTVTTVANLTLTNATISSGNVTVTTGVFGAGSNTAPSITTTGDTNTGIFFPAADNIAFTQGGTEAMRIDFTGNVGIGTSSPLGKLEVRGSGNTALYLHTGNNLGDNSLIYFGDTGSATVGLLAYDHGTNAMTFHTNSAERMRIDSSGSLLVGQTTAAIETGSIVTAKNLEITRTVDSDGAALGQLSWVNNTNAGAGSGTSFVKDVACIKGIMDGTGNNSGGYITFETKADAGSRAERMRINSSGNVGIGATSITNNKLLVKAAHVSGGAVVGLQTDQAAAGSPIYLGFFNSSNTRIAYVGPDTATNFQVVAAENVPMIFGTNDTERMRITSAGELLVGTTSLSGARVMISATAVGGRTLYLNKGTGDTTDYFIVADTTTANRFLVLGSGNVQNTNNSYGAISDVKLKENIVDATPKLEDLCKVKVRNYNLKFDPDHKQIGVVAQELEQVFAGLVEETKDIDKDGNDLGTTTKSVKYSVFVPMLIKAVQEQQALIENLTTRLNALEGK
jgi:hypothetical protein